MLGKILAMAIRGPIKSLFAYLYLYHCFDVDFHLCKFNGVPGSGLSFDPQNVTQNLKSLAQNYLGMYPVTDMPYYGSNWRFPVIFTPMSREKLRF